MSSAPKKKWLIAAAILFALVVITSVCIYLIPFLQGGRGAGYSDVTAQEVTSQIIEDLELKDITAVSQDQLVKHYNIPDGLIEDFSIYVSKSANKSFELACFKLLDRKNADQLDQVIAEHITTKGQGFKELNPAEYEKIQSYRVVRKGKFVLMVISDNAPAIEKEFFASLS